MKTGILTVTSQARAGVVSPIRVILEAALRRINLSSLNDGYKVQLWSCMQDKENQCWVGMAIPEMSQSFTAKFQVS